MLFFLVIKNVFLFFENLIIERFFFQIIACLIVVGFGINISNIGDYLGITIYLGGFGILLTFVTMIGYINAINFSDGLGFSSVVTAFLNLLLTSSSARFHSSPSMCVAIISA